MSLRGFAVAAIIVVGITPDTPSQAARWSESETVRRASRVLQQIMSAPAQGIPLQLLSDAQAVVIVPQMKSGAFVVGIRKGHGVLVVRENNGLWRAPQFVEMTGGSLGWQAGVQSSDVILVFRSSQSLQNLMQGKLTIGADASVAAGPVGRQVAAATDLDLSAEIYSYSRSRGAFVGVAIDGTVLKSDPHASARYYQPPGTLPAEAGQLVSQLASYAGSGGVAATSLTLPAASTGQFDLNQRQLLEAFEKLKVQLDPTWANYLALPPEAYHAQPIESELFEALDRCLARYESVNANSQYSALTSRPEFQLVLVSLRQSVSLPPAERITLPSPPAGGPQFPR